MKPKRVFVFGATGHAGRAICHYLLNHTDVTITVASRSLRRAEELMVLLNDVHDGDRVDAVELGEITPDTVRPVLKGARVFVQAGPALNSTTLHTLITACIETKTHWVDIQLPISAHNTVASHNDAITAAHLTFATQGGFHPGVPAAMVRWAQKRIKKIDRARVSGWLNPEAGLPASSGAPELLDLLRDYHPKLFRNGDWETIKLTSSDAYAKVQFPFGVGTQYVSPMDLHEILYLPESIPSLRELSFLIGGFNPVTNYVIGPLLFAGIKLLPQIPDHKWGNLLAWSTQRFPKPPFGTVLQIDAAGPIGKGRKSIHFAIRHDDAYDFTAIPVVAYIKQLLDGRIRQRGVHYMAMLPQPDRFFDDMAEMGVERVEKMAEHVAP